MTCLFTLSGHRGLGLSLLVPAAVSHLIEGEVLRRVLIAEVPFWLSAGQLQTSESGSAGIAADRRGWRWHCHFLSLALLPAGLCRWCPSPLINPSYCNTIPQGFILGPLPFSPQQQIYSPKIADLQALNTLQAYCSYIFAKCFHPEM